jgi:hypothetical protein
MRMLLVLKGPDQGRAFTLAEGGQWLLGRDSPDLPLGDTRISRRHATLRHAAGQWELEDHGSANGTYVNKSRVKGTIVLHAGDQVQVGRTLLGFGLVETERAAEADIEVAAGSVSGGRGRSGGGGDSIDRRTSNWQAKATLAALAAMLLIVAVVGLLAWAGEPRHARAADADASADLPLDQAYMGEFVRTNAMLERLVRQAGSNERLIETLERLGDRQQADARRTHALLEQLLAALPDAAPARGEGND